MHSVAPRRPRLRIAGSLCLTALAVAPAAAEAKLTVYPTHRDQFGLANAMVRHPSLIHRARFVANPPGSAPAVRTNQPLPGFPRVGNTFAILSNGNAKLAYRKNRSTHSGSTSGGPSIRGARDVVMLRLDLRVPKGRNCLTFNFRFLSEEFPEFVNDIFNDAFIAELDGSNWDASGKEDPSITAPLNFAVDSEGNPIRVNTVGDASMKARFARGTTYDGATRILRASTPITPGKHHLYLSIFDQGDRIFDSAVFLDNLGTVRAKRCRTGVAVAK